MLDDEQAPTAEKQPVDYTGVKIGAILAPVFFLFLYFGKADMALTVFIVLGMVLFAIKLRWKLRKHVWFWATIVLILALHVPLLFLVHWPKSNAPTIAYSLPLGIVDFLLISGALGLAEKLFSKGSSRYEGDQ
jgi:hypothetical protein